MKAKHLKIASFLVVSLVGCGSDSSDFPNPGLGQRTTQDPRNSTPETNQVVLPVDGTASFGSQCPRGYIAPPQPAPLEFVSSSSSLNHLELSQALSPIVFQIDCKKNTLDIRGMSRTAQASTWEFAPSGQINFSIDGGRVHFKDDGRGNLNCSTPALIEIQGKVDCSQGDNPIIRAHVFWNLGKTGRDLMPPPRPQPGYYPNHPTPDASSAPATPTGSTVPAPTAATPSVPTQPGTPPSPSPQPIPSAPVLPTPRESAANGRPTPNRFGFPFSFRFPYLRTHLNEVENREQPQCNFPEESYLQVPEKIEIKQCTY